MCVCVRVCECVCACVCVFVCVLVSVRVHVSECESVWTMFQYIKLTSSQP